MREYINKIPGERSSEYDGSATTPAATYIFEVHNECPKIENMKRD